MFKTKTVDSILAVFNKTIDELAKHEAEQINLIETKRTERKALDAQIDAANIERERAKNAIGKLNNIFKE